MKLAKVNVVGADTGRSTKAHRGTDIPKVRVPADTLKRIVISRAVKMAFDGAAEHGAEH
jgi:hypothetical protein